MSELRNQIYKILEKHFVDTGYLDDIAEEIYTLIQPDLDELTQYREMFEGLRVEKGCTSCFAGLKCTVCGDTGKLYRPLTMEERKEFIQSCIEFLFWDINDDTVRFSKMMKWGLSGVTLYSGVKVVKIK